MSLHPTDIIRIAKRVFPAANINLYERSYSVVSLDYIAGEFANFHFHKRTPYKLNAFDCNKLAIEAALMLYKTHAHNSDSLTGPAFGWMIYTPDTPVTAVQYDSAGQHCINWFISGEEGREKVYFWEPQRSSVVHPTNDEINSTLDLFM